MKYLILLACALFVACGGSEYQDAQLHLTRYEVTCPVTMNIAKVDTVDAFEYYYGSNYLGMKVPPAQPYPRTRQYPKTCVVSFIQDWQEGK